MSQLPKDLLDILACPRCRGPLVVEPASLRCDACLLRYRVDNGIPVMLIHEAEPVDQAVAPTASVATDAGAAQNPS